MVTFDELVRNWGCRPIRNCPGRYVLGCPPHLAPARIAGDGARVTEHHVAAARDAVYVTALERGGLISYRHQNGTFTHTLNDDAGFRRKLAALGITGQNPR